MPLMHGSTSPSKNGWPAFSQRQLSRTSATAARTRSSSGSTPHSGAGRGCTRSRSTADRTRGSTGVAVRLARGTAHRPPRPSSPWSARSRALASPTTLVRSAPTTSADASHRSRRVCQRIEGVGVEQPLQRRHGRSLPTRQGRPAYRRSMPEDAMTRHDIAQLNVGRAVAPLDDAVMADFMNWLDEINALAERGPLRLAAPGRQWQQHRSEGERRPAVHRQPRRLVIDRRALRLRIAAPTTRRCSAAARMVRTAGQTEHRALVAASPAPYRPPRRRSRDWIA